MAGSESTKIVLISGANQGLGLALTSKIATLPGYYVFMGSRDLSRGQEAAKSFTESQRQQVEPIQLDISSDGSISRAVELIKPKYGRIDVLVNNAGVMPDGPAVGKLLGPENARSLMRQAMETNVTSNTQMTESCLPLILESKDPRIVFMSSGLGSLASTVDKNNAYYGYHAPAYKSSKAALNMVMLCYAVKLAKYGVKVNACCPGAVSTGMNGFREGLGTVEQGTVNAMRLVTEIDGDTGTFTATDEERLW